MRIDLQSQEQDERKRKIQADDGGAVSEDLQYGPSVAYTSFKPGTSLKSL